MTATEKIIFNHCEKRELSPGDIVYVDVDYCMINDATINLTIDLYEKKIGVDSVWDPDKIILIKDHQVPTDSIDTANAHKRMDDFAGKFGIKNIYHAEGICHQVMCERHVKPGALIVGADSHTCSYGFLGCVSTGIGSTDCAAVCASGKMWMKVPETYKFRLDGIMPLGVYSKDIILKIIGDISAEGANYKCMEFEGEAIDAMSLSERFAIANMTVEAGAKSSMMIPDEKVISYLKQKGIEESDYTVIAPDEDAIYAKEFHYDVSDLVPQIACPHSVDNVKPVSCVHLLQGQYIGRLLKRD
jgi:3-isopropylmalate/(R)-2-methylmalate dehydratase large subunit